MKKLRFAMILLLCLGAFLCLGAAAHAEPAVIDSGTCGDSLTWKLYDTGELVIDGTGAMNYGDGTAPWYESCEKISSVTIRDGVTSIGDAAFYECSSLTSVTIPDGVTSIGELAFCGCSSLTSVTIPDSVTSIGNDAFTACSGLTSVTIPDGVTSIGGSAFYGCSSLTSVTIPDSVTSIGNAAFADCSGLTSVTIPDSVTSIGSSAFYGCSGLTSVTIPDSVTSIGNGAFNGCSNLTDVYYGGSEEQWKNISIGNNNAPLTNATIHCLGAAAHAEPAVIDSGTCGDNLTWTLYDTGELVIDGTGAMANYDEGTAPWYESCEKISTVTIRDDVTSIGSYAFFYCSSLTSVTIPESVTSIGDGAFEMCSGLTSVTIPEAVTSIGEWTFNGCSSLTSVTIPEGVTSIGVNAFCNCSSLTSVTIPEGVTSIDGFAFSGCSGLTSVTIPEGVTSIGSYAFALCSSLTSVTIPESVTSIGEGAFNGCSNLTDVYYGGSEEQWKTISIGADDDSLTNATIHYNLVIPNPDFVLPASLNVIESEAFTGGAFTYVYIPETVARIESGAFASCPKLAYAQFAGADTEIDPTAFSGVIGLTIIAPTGSTAEAFATAHGFDFQPAA